MKKSLTSAVVALVLSVLMAMPALALRKLCISIYEDGELCERYCEFYTATGDPAGSIYENYGC